MSKYSPGIALLLLSIAISLLAAVGVIGLIHAFGLERQVTAMKHACAPMEKP